ncbi:MAG: D-isomer specific 2-hydroxyacid dehydrogenase family protein [Faecalibacterium sp.]
MKVFLYSMRPFDELVYCEQMRDKYGIDFDYCTEYPSPENIHLAAGCDAVSTNPCDMSAPMVEAFHQLGVKYLPCRSIGYDHIDLATAKRLGMRVSHASYPPCGVANYAIMLMLMSYRSIVPILKRSEVQDFSLKGKIGRDISYATVGVIGTGNIGKTVIKSLSGFGCKILAYDTYQNEETKQYAQYVPMEQLLAESDIITLHTNATDENYHLIDAAAIAKMKDGVVIINTARGKLLDSEALIAGLKSGKVGGAGLDVLEDENGLFYYNRNGDVIDNDALALLTTFPNVILCPHTAFYTEDAVESMVASCFESVHCFANDIETWREVKL